MTIEGLFYRLVLSYYKLLDVFTKQSNSYIVMFHHVRDDEAPNVEDSCKCTISEFLNFVHIVKEHYKVVDLGSFMSCELKNRLVITFDDVPDNFFNNAYPILKSEKLPFTLYIASGLIDQRGYLSLEDLKVLSKDPLCTIGAHTVSHPRLSLKNVDINKELFECKQILENKLQIAVNHFAYPYGTPSAVGKEAIFTNIRTRIYDTAVSTIPTSVNSLSKKHRYFLPRVYHKLFIKMRKYETD